MKKRAFLVPVAAAVAGLLGSSAATPATAVEPTDSPNSGAALPGATVDPAAPHTFTVASPGGRLDAFVLSRGPGEVLFADHQSHASHHSHHSHKSHHSHTSGT
jgi:hypothetical protein